MKLESIKKDHILNYYSRFNGDKLAIKFIVYYCHDCPRYGDNNKENYVLYVEKMKLVITTMRSF